MLLLTYIASPIEVLLQIIISQYLTKSYCLTVVSEIPFDFNFPSSVMYIIPNDNDSFLNQLLDASERGCSDYIVRMNEPKVFMTALERVTHLGNVRRSDKKILFMPLNEDYNSTNLLLQVLSMKESSFLANILLIVPDLTKESDCMEYDLVTHRYVGPDADVNEPLYLDRWNSCTEKFIQNGNLFPHNMMNLYGKTVKVACFTYKPYVLLDLDPAKALLGRDGTEMRIVDEFCRWINCTVEIVQEDNDQWGEIYENDTGIGVIGSVFEDRADLGITALYSWYEEYKVLDFSVACIRTAITCVAPAPRLLQSWQMPFLPFSWNMWFAVFITFIFASIGLTGAHRFSTDKIFLTVFGIMISQSLADAELSWRSRSITGWLLTGGLILATAYGGGLASTFTVPKYEPSIDTAQDVVDRNMEWGATHDAWIFSLTLSQEPLVKQLVSRFRTYPAEKLREKSFTRNMAFSVEKLPAGYFAIGEYITKEALLDMTLMLEDFYYEQCVVMLRKNSAFTEKISQFVGRLHQSGLIMAWETQVVLNHMNFKVQLEVKLSRSRSDVGNTQPLSPGIVVGIFIVYTTGVILSFLLFIGELMTHKISNKTDHKLSQ